MFRLKISAEGLEVVSMESVIDVVDAIILCTENQNIIGLEEIEKLKTNCLLINYGHSSCEMDYDAIKNLSIDVDTSNPNVLRLTLPSKKIVKILFNGEPVQSVSFQLPKIIHSLQSSITAVAIMELSLYSREKYNGGVYLLPKKLDEYIALIHLKIFSATLTKLTDEQSEFLGVSKDGPFKGPHYRY
ncbi:putative adenosylhomocysteinase 2 [Thelohanellus kitauei]|uniref:Putative adenosylhomocysteinase 2 n=1 Tax=Thelohanellus kitauei TaxID=669202 RepID=A0A0C2ISF2_THEKT|nr:putative adenosylhomocysteinase 2 [Thelohanellus kitauei]